MEQVKGIINLIGSPLSYSENLEKIRDNKIFNIIDNRFNVFIYGLTSEDYTRMHFYTLNVGNKSYSEIMNKGVTTQYSIYSDMNMDYKNYGIDVLRPLTYTNYNWPVEKTSIQYDIRAENTEEYTPIITGINLSNTNPFREINISWDSKLQDKYHLIIRTGGTLIYEYFGGTEKNHTIPPNKFVDKQQIEIGIKVEYTHFNTLTSNGYAIEKINTTLNKVLPTISNFKPSSGNLNALAPIIISWESTLQTSYTLQVYSDNKIIKTYSGTTERTLTIPENTLFNGNISFKLTISDGYSNISNEVYYTISNNPKVQILGLEPNNVIKNKSFDIEVAWVSLNQKSWLLNIYENNVLKSQFKGSTETNLILPADFLKVGQIKLELYAFNTVYGEDVSTSKISMFTTISKPKSPTQDEKINYNTSLPAFTWTPDGKQLAFQVQIYKSDVIVEDSNIKENESPLYLVTKSLENNTTYLVKVRTKNEYELWSDYSSKEIYISYTLLEAAIINVNPDNNTSSVLINYTSPTSQLFAQNQIWRDDGLGFKLIATNLGANGNFIDYYAPTNKVIKYKIISKSTEGATTESQIKETKILIEGFLLANAENTIEKAKLKFNYDIGFQTIRNRQFVKYLGNKKMIVEDDMTTQYLQGSFSFLMKLEDFYMLENLYNTNKTLFYRDNRGKAVFCSISSFKEDYLFRIPPWTKATFELIEIENDIQAYADGGGNKTLVEIKLDGTWILNGEKDLVGWEWVNI